VENEVKRDTPDLYFTARSTVASTDRPLSGWIELKVLDAFPAKATTTIKLPKWTNGQRHWALRHRSHGGYTWLVVQVGEEVFVHNAKARRASKRSVVVAMGPIVTHDEAAQGHSYHSSTYMS